MLEERIMKSNEVRISGCKTKLTNKLTNKTKQNKWNNVITFTSWRKLLISRPNVPQPTAYSLWWKCERFQAIEKTPKPTLLSLIMMFCPSRFCLRWFSFRSKAFRIVLVRFILFSFIPRFIAVWFRSRSDWCNMDYLPNSEPMNNQNNINKVWQHATK